MVYQDLVPHESEREGGKVVGYISYRSTLIHITRQPPIIKIRALLLLFSDNIILLIIKIYHLSKESSTCVTQGGGIGTDRVYLVPTRDRIDLLYSTSKRQF